MQQHFHVCCVIGGHWKDRTVTIDEHYEQADFVSILKQKIHPDRQGDQSDGLVGQRCMDCVIVSFSEIPLSAL